MLEQETRNKHFINFDNEPVVAFDGGYGITQMTNPIPTYEQVWNWKKNIDGGSDLYIQKRKNAQNYLIQKSNCNMKQLAVGMVAPTMNGMKVSNNGKGRVTFCVILKQEI